MDRIEAFYHAKGAWSRPGTIETACALVPDWGRGRHLDVGCGVGRLLLHARPLRGGRPGFGVDLTRRLVVDARRKYGAAEELLVQGDAVALPFADESFDVVTCTETIEHAGDLDRALAEVARVLVPGGWFALSMPVYANLLWLDKRLGDRRLARERPAAHGVAGLALGWAPWEPEPIERSVPPRRMLRLLAAHGLVSQRAFTRDFFVTVDRSFLGRILSRVLPPVWRAIERRAGRIDAAAEGLGRALPFARYWGYKFFCLCRREG